MKHSLLPLILLGSLISGTAQDLPAISLESKDGRKIVAQILYRLADGKVGFRVRRENGAEFDIESRLLTADSILAASQELQRREMELAGDIEEILVSHKFTKLVNGKYQYWFDIQNHRIEAFSGKVKVTLLGQKEGTTHGDAVFSSPAPINPESGASASLDSDAGPPSADGDASVVGFLFQVIEKEKVVFERTGKIPDQVR